MEIVLPYLKFSFSLKVCFVFNPRLPSFMRQQKSLTNSSICYYLVLCRAFIGLGLATFGLFFLTYCANTPAADVNGDGRISNAEYKQESQKIDAINRDIRRIERNYGL